MARDKSKEIRAIYEKPSEMRIGGSSLVGWERKLQDD
jgi:hypothetical protein